MSLAGFMPSKASQLFSQKRSKTTFGSRWTGSLIRFSNFKKDLKQIFSPNLLQNFESKVMLYLRIDILLEYYSDGY